MNTILFVMNHYYVIIIIITNDNNIDIHRNVTTRGRLKKLIVQLLLCYIF